MRDYKLTLNLVTNEAPSSKIFKQYDTGNEIELELYQNEHLNADEKLVLTNESVLAFFKRADGQVLQKNCTIRNGNAIVKTAKDVLGVPGTLELECMVKKGDVETTTTRMTFTVKESIARDGAIEEDPRYTSDLITELLDVRDNVKAETIGKIEEVASQLEDITNVGINVCSGIFPDLQTAFNFCADNGIPALMPSGTFNISDIIIKNKLHIKGNGQEKTILNYIGTGEFLKYDGTLYSGSKLFVIEDLTLVGSNKSGKAISMNNSTGRQVIRDINIRGFAYGIYAPTNCFYGTLDNVKIENCDIGLYMENMCYFWHVNDCQISNNRINLYAKGLLNNTFDNTDFSNASECSIKLDGGIRDTIFNKCWFEKNIEFIKHTNIVGTNGLYFDKCYFSTQGFKPVVPYIFNFEYGNNINIKECYFDNDISDTNEIFNIVSSNVGTVDIDNCIFANNNKDNLVKYPIGYLKERLKVKKYNSSLGVIEESNPILTRQYNNNILPNSKLYAEGDGWSKSYTAISQLVDEKYGNVSQIIAASGAFLYRTIDKTVINTLDQEDKPTYVIVRFRYKSIPTNSTGSFARLRFTDGISNDDKVYNLINDGTWHDAVLIKHTNLLNASCTFGFYNILGTYTISDIGLSVNGNLPMNLPKAISEDGGTIYGDLSFALSKGVIVKTPDGSKKYRVGVDNSGNLITTLI